MGSASEIGSVDSAGCPAAEVLRSAAALASAARACALAAWKTEQSNEMKSTVVRETIMLSTPYE